MYTVDVSVVTSDYEWRRAGIRLSVDVCPGTDQQPHHVDVSVSCRRHERRLTVLRRQRVDLEMYYRLHVIRGRAARAEVR